MIQRTDLYSILTSYANKNNSPYIEFEPVIGFIEKYAKQVSSRMPEWSKWTQDASVKFWAEIAGLAEEGKCELLSDTPDGRIYMPLFYVDILRRYYEDIDNKADVPFPDEESLNIIIPENRKSHLNVELGIPGYLERPDGDGDIPPIVQADFPGGFGTGLLLASMIPRRIMEASILKLRLYLGSHNNKEYVLRRLSPLLQGRDSYLKDTLNNIILKPMDCLRAIEEGGDFSYLFWAHFCILVKNDIKKKKERLNEDLAAVQAVCFLGAFNNYYRTRMGKRREKELAFKELELCLEQPPFHYTMEQILNFTGSRGGLLLDKYTKDELDEWLKKAADESGGRIPGLFIIPAPRGERWFVAKSKFLLLCARFLAEVRGVVKDAVSKRWLKLLREYRRESAMDNDKRFEDLLFRYITRFHPVLAAMLEDPRLRLVYDELEAAQGIPAPSRIFVRGIMVPYSSLLLLKRKELLTEIRILLPVWHSMPALSSLIAFLRGLLDRKKPQKEGRDSAGEEEEEDTGKESARDRQNAARAIEAALVPPNHSSETYLKELENRWIQLIGKKAREDLAEDVKSLVRDNLRRTLRVQKHFTVTRETLSTLASNIVNRTPSLQEISGKDSLLLYVELYLVKLMQNMKV
jgi:hypothetical protein